MDEETNRLLKTLNERLSRVITELASHTQALGENSTINEKVASGLGVLAGHTGEWRTDDKTHHKGEADADKKKLDKASEIITAINNLTEATNKKN